VESAVAARLREETQTLLVGDKTTAGKVLYASERFFSVFTFPLTQGDPKQVLRDKNPWCSPASSQAFIWHHRQHHR
jgi:hypothetical protein